MMIKENSVQNNIIRVLEDSPEGTIFNYSDFSTCGTYTAIRSAVVSICRKKLLVRLCQGIYVKPSINGKKYIPDNITLAKEIDRKNGAVATPKGKTFDYFNGKLKHQPDKLEFYSTGSGRSIKLPDGTIVKYTYTKEMHTKN